MLAIAAGVLLFIAGREQQLGQVGAGDPRNVGREMPGDIHNYHGQMTGGRSTSWQSHDSGGDGGGGD